MATVELFGQEFGLSTEISEFALMEFAEAASSGQDGDTMQGFASTLRFVRECIVADDVERFNATARRNKAKMTDLMVVIRAAFEQDTERPTSRPSDSSDGPSVIEPNSGSSAAGRVSRLAGRPDLQLMVRSA